MVTKKRKPNRTSFKKGVVTNPRGGGATLPIMKTFKEYTTKVVAEMYTDLMNYSTDELNLIIDDPKTGALRVIIAQTLLRDIKNKEMGYAERVLNRIIGPVPSVQEVGSVGGGPLPVPPVINIIKHEVAKDAGTTSPAS